MQSATPVSAPFPPCPMSLVSSSSSSWVAGQSCWRDNPAGRQLRLQEQVSAWPRLAKAAWARHRPYVTLCTQIIPCMTFKLIEFFRLQLPCMVKLLCRRSVETSMVLWSTKLLCPCCTTAPPVLRMAQEQLAFKSVHASPNLPDMPLSTSEDFVCISAMGVLSLLVLLHPKA